MGMTFKELFGIIKEKARPYLEKAEPYFEKARKYVRENKPMLKMVAWILAVMFLTAHIKGCIAEMEKNRVYPRLVQTGKAFKQTVPIYLDSFGTLSSPEDVDIRSQVTGKILEANFTQGQEVKAGDLLFTIDPSEYKADLDKARAQLEEDIAKQKLANDKLDRNRPLVAKNLISQQDFEDLQTQAAAAGAQVQLSRAQVELAEINLGYCYIKSPVDGLTGKRLVDIGNIVSANTGPVLVNVKTISELYLDFTLPERDLEKVRKAMGDEQLDVKVTIPGEKDEYKGKLEFINNDVDDKTGTFALRAIVNNDKRRLWAGQFVNVRLILGSEEDAVLVPYDAAQIGKQGYYVFLAKGRKADLRNVTVGSRQGDNIVIKKGVEPGETVITKGQLGLAPGMSIYDITDRVKKQQAEEAKKGKK